MFMADYRWLENYIHWIQYEQVMTYRRESFAVGVFMNQEHHYGLPERSAKFLLEDT